MKKSIKKIISFIIIFTIVLSGLPFSKQNVSAANATLKVKVIDKETRAPISNAEFKLINKENSTAFWTRRTDSNGEFIISAPGGKYVLSELSVPEPHKVSSDIDVTLIDDKTTIQLVENVKKGTSISGSIVFDSTILKIHARNQDYKNEPIANAQFLVKGEGVRVIVTTDSNGEAQVPGLRAGKYTISQISAPDGFSGVPDDTIVNIPKPNPEKYAEFADVTIYNKPYDKEKWGTLNIDVYDNANRSVRVPNAKIKVTDDIGNTYLGTTDSNGHIIFRGMSRDRTYRIGIIEVPYDYYLNNFVFVENVKLDKITNSQTQSLYLPKRTTQLITFVNFEKGNFDRKIQNSIFKLIHEDGSSRSFQITNSNGELQMQVPEGNYILQQISTDSEHNTITENIPFEVNRPVTINIENTLKDFQNKKTEVKFTKVWEDNPQTPKVATIRLYKNGVRTDNVITVSSNDNEEKVFSDLPVYESDHSKVIYSVKEDELANYYASYEQDRNNPNKWIIKNHEGNLEGTCEPSSMWMSTENTAYRLVNGTTLTKTVIFPTWGSAEDKTHGYAIAYDQPNGYLYGINKNGQLAVMDTTRGVNGTHIKTVDLMRRTGNLGYDRLAPKNVGNYHRIVNSAEITGDKKYVMVKMASVPEIYMFRIADILSANSGDSLSPAKVISAHHSTTRNFYPFSDGDVIQYENGDILYTGHELQHKSTSDIRQQYYFYLLKYNGKLSDGKVVDAASGSYSAPVRVGRISNHPLVNNVTSGQYNWQTIEGITYVDGRMYITSNMTNVRNKTITKRWARLEASYNGGPVLPTRNTNENTAFRGAVFDTGDVTRISGSSLTDMSGGNTSSCNIKVNIRGAKTWLNDNSSDRPSSVIVRLYENGNRTNQTREINADNNWAYSFDSLPKFPENGDVRKAIKYTVKEENVPEGYVASYDEKGFNITNTLIKGKFSILKTNETGSQALNGASFSLLNEDESKVVIASKPVDNNGVLSFSELKPGTYWLKEDKAPDGYIRDAEKYKVVGTINNTTKKIDFVITKNDQSVGKSGESFVIKNNLPKFPIKIVKVDGESNDKITTHSRFAITNVDGQIINGQQADLMNGEFTFNNDGQGFTPGVYYLKEVTAPDGYEELNAPLKLEIFSDGSVALSDNQNAWANKYGINSTNGNLIELRVKNNRQGFSLKLLKVDKDDVNKKLQGATFKLFDTDMTTQVGSDLTTNSQGELLINGLQPKIYYLQETAAPSDYKLNDKKYKLNIAADGRLSVDNADDRFEVGALEGNIINVKFKDEKIKYAFKIVKTNKNLDKITINGTRFRISKTENGPTYNGQQANLSNGEFIFDNRGNKFEPGVYYLIEETAPSGYKGNPPIKITITDNGEVVTDTSQNSLVDISKVGDNSNTYEIKVKNERAFPIKLIKVDKGNNIIRDRKTSFDILNGDTLEKITGGALDLGNGGEKIFDNNGNYFTAGKYILKENIAPDNYTLLPTPGHILPFEILEDGSVRLERVVEMLGLLTPSNATVLNNNTIELKIKNDKQKRKIRLEKSSKQDNNAKLHGVKFKLFESDGTTQIGEELTTNAQGIVEFPEVYPGTYKLQESASIDNYRLNDKKYELIVADNGSARIINGDDYITVENINSQNVITVKLKNDREYPINIQKVARENGTNAVADLQGARLKIKAKAPTLAPKFKDFDIYKTQYKAVQNDDGSLEWMTGAGDVVFKLVEGTYQVEELNAPAGYNKVAPFEFKVASDGTVTLGNRKAGDKITIEVKDNRQSVKIEDKRAMEFYLNKKDNENIKITSGDLTVKIEGLNIFNGTDEKTFDLSKDYINNKGLKIEIPGYVPSGDYILTEKNAPVGYKKTKTRYHINVNQEMRTIALIKTDSGTGTKEKTINQIIYRENGDGNIAINIFDIINDKATYPNTGGYGPWVFVISGGLLIIISSRKVYRKNKEVNGK